MRLPDGAGERDGDVETGFARGFGDVDEDAVLDCLGAGVGVDHGSECGGVAGLRLRHGRLLPIPRRERGPCRREARYPELRRVFAGRSTTGLLPGGGGGSETSVVIGRGVRRRSGCARCRRSPRRRSGGRGPERVTTGGSPFSVNLGWHGQGLAVVPRDLRPGPCTIRIHESRLRNDPRFSSWGPGWPPRRPSPAPPRACPPRC